MLALDYIRRNAAHVRECARLKGEDAPLDEILALDGDWRAAQTAAEAARAEQNRLSREFGQSREQALLPRVKELAQQVKDLAARADELRARLDDLLLYVPNVFDTSVPIGADESANAVVRVVGDEPVFDFQPLAHYELGEALDVLDLERAARVSGSRFAFLKGDGAALHRALVQYMLDLHTGRHGYTEINAPFLVNSASMVGTAQLPKFAEDAFKVENRDLWLIPTAEVPVTNYHREEILEGARLPLKYAGYSPCFRSEAGSAGKDTRGYVRQHQFEKVELVKLTTPDTSMAELDALVADAETVLRELGIRYRVLLMCSGDMGFAQYKKFDLEAWAPGVGRWLEVSSCSAFNDFQARRAGLRFRPGPGEPPQFVHTLNGSGLALLRTWTCVVETYQTGRGTIRVPDVLRPYLGGREELGPLRG